MTCRRSASGLWKRLFYEHSERYKADYLHLKELVRDSEAWYKGQPVPFLYEPLFLCKEDLQAMEQIISLSISIFKKVIKRYETDPQYRRAFGFPKELEELILLENKLPVELPMMRLDLFYRNPEEFSIIEVNTDGSSAMNEDRVFSELLLNSKLMKEFKKSHRPESFELFDSWAEAVMKMLEGLVRPEPLILILDYFEGEASFEFRRFRDTFRAHGFRSEIARPQDVGFADGYLTWKGQRVDAVYRRLVTTDLYSHLSENEALVSAMKAGNTIFIGPVKTQIVHNKTVFAVLHKTEFQSMFSQEEKDYIRKHIPYTVKLNEESLKFGLDHQADLILKPEDLYASRGVEAGTEVSEETWKELLKAHLNDNYLLQRMVPPALEDMIDIEDSALRGSFRQLIGVFAYAHKLQGFFTRVGKETIISGSHDGRTVPTLYIEE